MIRLRHQRPSQRLNNLRACSKPVTRKKSTQRSGGGDPHVSFSGSGASNRSERYRRERDLFVVESIGNLHRTYVGEGDAQILRLAARVAARKCE